MSSGLPIIEPHRGFLWIVFAITVIAGILFKSLSNKWETFSLKKGKLGVLWA
jgi:hypothetical protein